MATTSGARAVAASTHARASAASPYRVRQLASARSPIAAATIDAGTSTARNSPAYCMLVAERQTMSALRVEQRLREVRLLLVQPYDLRERRCAAPDP